MGIEEAIEAAVQRGITRAMEQLRPVYGAPEELLTVREAAALAKVSAHTIREWVKEGLINRYGSRGATRIRRDELLTVKPKSPNPNLSPDEAAARFLGKGK